MTTLRTRAIVSLAAMATALLALGACVRAPAGLVTGGAAPIEGRPLTIRFDNDAREHVDVYLIGEQREWLLGRVAPGARATLRLPEASLAGRAGFVQLAVLTGARRTLQAARDGRARISAAQPPSALLSQQWQFAHGQLTSLRLRSGRVDAGRP